MHWRTSLTYDGLMIYITLLIYRQSVHQGTLKDTAMQKGGREAFKANMLKKLETKPWIAEHCVSSIPHPSPTLS